MDSRTMVMVAVAGNGTNIDSHYILDGCDNGVASSWNRSTHGTLNAAQPRRSGFDMDSHYIIDGYHYDFYRVQTNHSPNAAAIPLRRGLETGYRHISHPPSMLYHPDAAFTQRRGFRTGYRHISQPPSMLYHPNAAFTIRRRGFGTDYRHISHPPSTAPIGFHHVDDAVLLTNHPSNVPMETENTSYEQEFLALAERVGNVSTGLSDEIITAQLKTKDYIGTGDAEDNDCCVICQDEYITQEKVGILHCGHEYHASCLRKWLQMKNVCPMCKSEALSAQ